jgi:hypothetical protein
LQPRPSGICDLQPVTAVSLGLLVVMASATENG